MSEVKRYWHKPGKGFAVLDPSFYDEEPGYVAWEDFDRQAQEIERLNDSLRHHGVCDTCGQLHEHRYTTDIADCGCGPNEWFRITPHMKRVADLLKPEHMASAAKIQQLESELSQLKSRQSGVVQELIKRAGDVVEGLHGENLPGALPVRIQKLKAALERLNPAEQLNKAQGDIFGWFRTPKGCPLQGVFIRTNEDSETDIQNAIDMGFSVERLYTAPPSIPTITEADLEKSGLGYPLPKEQAVQLWNKGFRSEPITVLEAWEAIGHDIGCNPSKDELFDSLRNMSSICRAHGCDMPSIPETSVVVERTQAATDVLVERQRQIEKEGWTPEHDDEHSNYEIAGLACFYAMPPGAREWDASSTGYGDTLAEAIIPHGWTVKEGDRRAELIKAGALVLAEIERLDRAILSSKGGDV